MKNSKKSYVTNMVAFIILIIMSIGIFSLYPKIKEVAKEEPSVPYENYEILRSIYRSNYVLYKDILDQENGEELTGDKIYIKLNETNFNEYDDIKINFNNNINFWKEDLNHNYLNLNYLAYNNETSINKTNTDNDLRSLVDSTENENLNNKYAFYMVISYDGNGGVSVNNIFGADDYTIRNRFSEFTMRDTLDYNMLDNKNIKFNPIRNATFIYGIPKDLKYSDNISEVVYQSQNNYNSRILITAIMTILFGTLILGLMIPYGKGNHVFGIKTFLKIPFEINCIIFGIGAVFSGFGSFYALYSTIQGLFSNGNISFSISPELGFWLTNIANMLIWIIAIYLIFAGDMLLKHIFKTGLVKYFKENLLIFKIIKSLKRWSNNLIEYIEHIDLTDKSNKVIIKVLAINFLVISVISIVWFFGILASIVYTVALFIIIRKYVDNIKEKFGILLNATNKIADGNLDVEINEDLGLFNPFKDEVKKIQDGFKKAVSEEVKSQRMKTELISNVSHDLKTPLTSIITYVDLLKNNNITDEERKSYIDTIDKKSQRLKFLIEDLFEVSKATSGDIKLNLVNIDIVELMRQIEIELNDKISASNLNLRNNFPENKVILKLDSQKTYRIFENLLINVVNYAMEGSRVYVDIIEDEKSVEITIKNMSAEEINFNAFDIVERFERGDKSRNTEGSGLGLAIAKSFVEVQGGTLNVDVDGDLFKVIIILEK
ncbi:sensor histidine kinase [Clostridium beijerinckii]|nr:sensor histidine kinase [Clostridium beijerinckii]